MKRQLQIFAGHHASRWFSLKPHGRDGGKILYKNGKEFDNEHWLMERLVSGGVQLLRDHGYTNFNVLPFDMTLLEKIKYLNDNCNKFTPVIEFHANASISPYVSGSEVYYTKDISIRSKEYAEEMAKIVSKTMNVKNRGAKTEELSFHKTLGIISRTITYDFLVELGFMTNEGDYKKMNETCGEETVFQACKYILDKKT